MKKKHLLFALAVAFAVRVWVIFHFHTYAPDIPGASYGFETGMISKALAEGRGFSSPFGGDTGPTAWFPPVHVTIQAVLFRLFGVQSTSSAIAIRIFNVLVALGSCILLFRICDRLWGKRFAYLSLWCWVFFPNSLWFDATLISYGPLSVMLLLAAVDSVLAMDLSQPRLWAAYGALWGIIALTNPVLLSVLPFCWAVAFHRTPASHRWRAVALVGAFFCLFCVPWVVRDYVRFGKILPIRGNMGHELYKGNRYGATGEDDFALNPWNNPVQFAEYARLGERAYVEEHERIAKDFIHKNPSGFFRLTRRRIYLFWTVPRLGGFFEADSKYFQWGFLALSVTGLASILIAIFAGRSQSTEKRMVTCLFAAIVLVYPLPYYITFPSDRYRYPIEPILLIFALHLLTGFRAFQVAPEPAHSATQVLPAV